MNYSHTTVLLNEAVDALNIRPGGTYVDATMGGGGHSELICSKIGPDGTFIGIDQDQYAQNRAQARLEKYPCRKIFIKDNFKNLRAALEENGIAAIDGIVYDLGVSSFQLDDEKRGFSYHHDGPLDMRMDETAPLSAAEVVNTYPQEELTRVLRVYGEEKFAPRIAQRIVSARAEQPIETTGALADIIRQAYPAKERYKSKHPARKTFQALRIEVNKELSILEPAFDQALSVLKPGGRIAVITFHSLEDRIVKQYFKQKQNPCTCPPDFPVCVCGKKPELKIITKKPVVPDAAQVAENNRARSAKLRVAEKV